MALAVRSTTSQYFFNTQNCTLTLPSNQSGDIILLFCSRGAIPSSFAAGYTQLSDSPASTANFAFSACGYKISSGAESNPTISWPAAGTGGFDTCIGCVVISGCDTTTPVKAEDASIDSAFDTTVPGVTLDAAGSTVFSVLMLANENTSGGVSFPVGWTEHFDRTDSCPVSAATNESPGTGSIAPGNVTIGNGRQKILWHVLVQATAAVASASRRYTTLRRGTLRRGTIR